MSKRVKTTKIEKKYKDKQGNEKKIEINYSKVVDRIAEFRADNPRGKIETDWKTEDDLLVFKAYVHKDQADTNSANATGHAMAKIDGTEKQFEKLETIAVGRALAMLGYAASGEVASFDEMEEYQAYRDGKIEEIIEKMANCKTIPALREYFMSLGTYMAESRIIQAKDERKAQLNADSGTKAE